MRNTPPFILAFAFLLSVPISALAYLEDYGPFTKTKPKHFPLKKLNLLEKDEEHRSFGVVRNGRAVALLKFVESQQGDDYFVLLSIFDRSGKLVRDSLKVCDSFFLQEAYAGDLNRDGIEDYVIQIHSGGAGLGGYANFIVFALSGRGSYETITVSNWDSDSVLRDLVDLKRNGHCQFIHASFTYIDTKKGLSHSHWVYNILEVKGTKLVLANHLNPMFPKWVWYTIRPNHKPSPFVNQTKALAWTNSKYPSFFWTPEKTEQ